MVKGIFLHDLPIYKDINGAYGCTTLTNDVFKRYFDVVDELVVATRVYILSSTCEEAHQERITLPNIRFIDIPNLNKPQYLFTRIPKAKKIIENEMLNCDLVFIRGGVIALLGAKVARKLGKKHLVECGGCAWDDYWNHSLAGKIIAPYMEYNAKKTMRNASYVVYVTESYLQNHYPTNGISENVSDAVITNIDEQIIEVRKNRFNNVKNGNATWVIGTAGAVNYKLKGQRFIIEAIAKLKDEYDIRYEMAGAGDQDYLKSIASQFGVEDRVVFKGELSHVEVLEWLDSIDTYVQPSMQEGLPRALVEAMSRGCPCMGSTVGGIPELLEKDTLFEKGKVDELVKTMMLFFESDWINHSRYNQNKASGFLECNLFEKRRKIFEKYRNDVLEEKNE